MEGLQEPPWLQIPEREGSLLKPMDCLCSKGILSQPLFREKGHFPIALNGSETKPSPEARGMQVLRDLRSAQSFSIQQPPSRLCRLHWLMPDLGLDFFSDRPQRVFPERDVQAQSQEEQSRSTSESSRPSICTMSEGGQFWIY